MAEQGEYWAEGVYYTIPGITDTGVAEQGEYWAEGVSNGDPGSAHISLPLHRVRPTTTIHSNPGFLAMNKSQNNFYYIFGGIVVIE